MRYKVLDSWRGIAALLVAAFHFPVSGFVHNAALVRHAYLFVDFFFVLSGFVIAHTQRDGIADVAAFRGFLMRRLGRLYPLYAVVLTAFAGIEIIKLAAAVLLSMKAPTPAFATGSFADPSALLLHFALLQVFGFTDGLSWNWPDWSIAAEVWTYCLFGLVCLTAFSYRRAVLGMLCAMAFVVLFELSKRGIEVTYDLGFVRCVYGFTAGALVYELWRRVPFALNGVLASVSEVGALCVALAFVVLSGRNPTSFAAPAVFGALIFVFAFEGGVVSRALTSGPFQALGRLSYAIYIVHALVVLVFSQAASVLLVHPSGAVWRTETYDGISERILDVTGSALPDALTAVYLVTVVGVAVLIWRFIETPARNAVNGWAVSLARSQGVPA